MDNWSITLEAAQFIVVLFGATWAYLRFWREGVHKPRIQFDIDCSFYGPPDGQMVAAFRVLAYNKGHVEYRFDSIKLRALGLKKDEPLTDRKGSEPMLLFPHTLFKKVQLVPEKFGYFFVRPGVNQAFTYTTHIPGDIRFLVARATFRYKGTDDTHTAERTFEVSQRDAS